MDTKSLQLACKPLIYTAEQSDFEALGHLPSGWQEGAGWSFFWILSCLLKLALTASLWMSCPVVGWVDSHCSSEEELTEGQSWKGCSEWNDIWLGTGHQQCSSGISSRARFVQCVSKVWTQELNAPLAHLLMTKTGKCCWLPWWTKGLSEESR